MEEVFEPPRALNDVWMEGWREEEQEERWNGEEWREERQEERARGTTEQRGTERNGEERRGTVGRTAGGTQEEWRQNGGRTVVERQDWRERDTTESTEVPTSRWQDGDEMVGWLPTYPIYGTRPRRPRHLLIFFNRQADRAFGTILILVMRFSLSFF